MLCLLHDHTSLSIRIGRKNSQTTIPEVKFRYDSKKKFPARFGQRTGNVCNNLAEYILWGLN